MNKLYIYAHSYTYHTYINIYSIVLLIIIIVISSRIIGIIW